MKIGLIIYGSLENLSGGYLYDRKLVEYLLAQGEKVEIISLPWRNYAAHLKDNWKFRLPHAREGFDLIIQDELNHPSLLAANSNSHPCPVISLVHHLRCSEKYPPWQQRLYQTVEKRYLQSVDGFIFNSNTTRRVVTRLVRGTAPDLIAYPPTDRFGSALAGEIVTARARESGRLRIVFLGNIIPRKGLKTLLAAVKLHSLDFSLDVVGSLDVDIVYANQIRRQVNDPTISENIVIHGALDNHELKNILFSAHVLVVPSSYEGFGIVYLEGMAFGLPAVGTTAGAAGEIINDGETGFLVQPEDAVKLGLCLSSLASDRNLLARMSLKALERYRIQPSWERTAEKIRVFLYKMADIKRKG